MENIVVPSGSQWEAVVRGCRNPYDSWDKSDSKWEYTGPVSIFNIGEADLALMMKLANAGDDHGKFMRMLPIIMDITAPTYWIAEFDTYKIGTVRNSCSLQHTGVSKPYSIYDFSVDPIIQEILEPIKEKKEHSLIYPREFDKEYREYYAGDRRYFVYRSGRVVADAYDCVHENDNRVRHFEAKECTPTQNICGYWYLNLGSHKNLERWMLHRLIATVWHPDTYFEGAVVNHKDGNKGNNCADNLEWVTHQENEIHKHENGLSGRTLHTDYIAWKNNTKLSYHDKQEIRRKASAGIRQIELAKEYNMSQSHISSIIRDVSCENNDVFQLAYFWEHVIKKLNELRSLYLDTHDYDYFIKLRQIMPMAYNYRFTWSANYQTLRHMYHARKGHKLSEWEDFRKVIRMLPHSELITGEELCKA